RNHGLEERRRRVALVAVLGEHDLGDLVGRIQSDEVEQRQWTHGIAAAQLHRLVDIRYAPHAALDRTDGIEQVRDEQQIDDEARGGEGQLGLHPQFAARPVPARCHPCGRARRGERTGYRQGDAAGLRLSHGSTDAARLRRTGYDLQDRRDHVHRVPRAALRAAAAPQAHGSGRNEWPEERQGLLRLFRRSAQGARPRRLTRATPNPHPPRIRMLGYDWPRFHAAVNDLPATLLFVTVLFDLGAWVTKRDSLKSAAVW